MHWRLLPDGASRWAWDVWVSLETGGAVGIALWNVDRIAVQTDPVGIDRASVHVGESVRGQPADYRRALVGGLRSASRLSPARAHPIPSCPGWKGGSARGRGPWRGRQQHPGEDGDDRDHHEEFDQVKSSETLGNR